MVSENSSILMEYFTRETLRMTHFLEKAHYTTDIIVLLMLAIGRIINLMVLEHFTMNIL